MRSQEWPGRSDRGRARETTVLSLNVMDVLGATQELLTPTLGCSRTWREEPRPQTHNKVCFARTLLQLSLPSPGAVLAGCSEPVSP